MKTTTLALAVTLLFSVAARAEPGVARSLPELLAASTAQQRPLLLDFGAVWCVPCKALAAELAKPEIKPLLDGFVLARYDAERGEGEKAAARYNVHSYPTLLLLDGEGHELARQEGFGSDVAAWLKLWSNASSAEIATRASKGDLAAESAMAARALADHDVAAQRKWLRRIEADDHTPERKEAANAGWQLAQLDANDKVLPVLRPILLDFIKRYPTHAMQPLELLVPAGVDHATLEASFERSVQATQDAEHLNLLVYSALEAGALDAALHAAERQVELLPDDANALDSLAEVWNARGEAGRSVALEQKAIALSKDEALSAAMRQNLARFEHADREPSPHSSPALLSRFVFGRERASSPQSSRSSASSTAVNLYWHESERVAKACAAQAPRGLDEAYVRLHVGSAPHAEKIELLEPRATREFKRCIEKTVAAVDVPPDSAPADIVVAFKLALPKGESLTHR